MGLTRAARRAAAMAKLRDGSVVAATGAAGPRPPLRVHIADLVLHGFPPAAGRRIGDGLSRELTRLFAADGVPRAMTSAAAATRFEAGSVRVAPGALSLAVGGQIARAIYGVRRR